MLFRIWIAALLYSIVGMGSAEATVCPLGVSHWGDQQSSAPGLFTGLLGLAVNQTNGHLVAGDGGNHRVQFFNQGTCPGNSADGCFILQAVIGNTPNGVAYADDGSVFLTLVDGNNLVKIDSSGNEVSPRATTTYTPSLITFDEVYRHVWATSPLTGTLYCYNENLGPLTGRNISFGSDHPQGIFAKAGFLYVTTDQERVYKIDLAAPPVTPVPIFSINQGSNHSPWGIVVDFQNVIFIAHKDSDIVNSYSESGALLSTITLPAGSAPRYLAIDNVHAFLFVSEAGYRVERYTCAVSGVGDEYVTGSRPVTAFQSAPNPAQSSVLLSFEVAQRQVITITIYDISGRRVRTLLDQSLELGAHSIAWDRRDDDGATVKSGVYLCTIASYEGSQSRKVVLAR